ncbi:hypothetical protein [Methylocystis heyeri]|uniref:Uncharacterized protein n=1 Tax=Methylocystis heyeri TaxID=391905 RepID=A0A6B8K8Q2_9HYPH|nr:hypothetical protein [Methylocystis heyeri]QGM44614.1 hypothetical protein H2LOC_002315 [Methylocystis heyeri]
MLTLLEALARLTDDKSALGWRLREVTATIKVDMALLCVKWDFPDEYYFYLANSAEADTDHIYRPKGVSDRDWFGPPPDKVMVAPPTEADIFCTGLLLGLSAAPKGKQCEGVVIFSRREANKTDEARCFSTTLNRD